MMAGQAEDTVNGAHAGSGSSGVLFHKRELYPRSAGRVSDSTAGQPVAAPRLTSVMNGYVSLSTPFQADQWAKRPSAQLFQSPLAACSARV